MARVAPAVLLSMTALTTAVLSALPADVQAQAYPAKPIRMIVPFPPGGNTDIIARGVANRMQELLGQTFVIENRGGAGSTIGTEVLARSPADGYVVGFVSSAHVFNAAILPKGVRLTSRVIDALGLSAGAKLGVTPLGPIDAELGDANFGRRSGDKSAPTSKPASKPAPKPRTAKSASPRKPSKGARA
jgi:hypothetical protein